MTPPSPGSGASTATYVFAVCRRCDSGVLSGVTGHAPAAPVRSLRVGALEAVVQDVPEAEFSEEALSERLADPVQLERCVRSHHAVVSAVAEHTAVVPLPLATLYRGDERARAALEENEHRFMTALARISGRSEWGVKVYARPGDRAGAPAQPETAPVSSSGAGRPGAGRAYLDRVRGRQRAREDRDRSAFQAAELVEARLREVAVAARRLRPHHTERTGDRGVQVLNATCLVPDSRCRELDLLVTELRGDPALRGVEIELSGPWAPYSFVQGGETDAGP
ncbi:GvpL/GvpF family gas vesicle protein [Streptomyces meridianus]|uniref:GvpL/GvpF family gas vesicle protein n=1 Tax=Streptomyces meridianus TaxID=2938945 RepID=A0ABT0XDX1_9ACTN|nr:GvpL/GvpF family gas vesicle protein [Streptomyces meridianus]MCM2579962.1 GvpL/GvpF family gas vesicle protein [Streptomyces meridianus]